MLSSLHLETLIKPCPIRVWLMDSLPLTTFAAAFLLKTAPNWSYPSMLPPFDGPSLRLQRRGKFHLLLDKVNIGHHFSAVKFESVIQDEDGSDSSISGTEDHSSLYAEVPSDSMNHLTPVARLCTVTGEIWKSFPMCPSGASFSNRTRFSLGIFWRRSWWSSVIAPQRLKTFHGCCFCTK